MESIYKNFPSIYLTQQQLEVIPVTESNTLNQTGVRYFDKISGHWIFIDSTASPGACVIITATDEEIRRIRIEQRRRTRKHFGVKQGPRHTKPKKRRR